MTIDVKLKSNIKQFEQTFLRSQTEALDLIGKKGLKNIKTETPFQSGRLKDSNRYRVVRGRTLFINSAPYAAFVELGTFLKSANPFMKRGLIRSRNTFINIIKRSLGV